MCQGNRVPRLVNRVRTFLKNEIFHTRVSKFLTRLAEQDHEHHPFDLFDIDIRRFQRQQAVYKYLALRGRQNANLFEIRDIAPTGGVEALMFEVVEDARTVLSVGDEIEARFVSMDRKSRVISLSIKAKEAHEEQEAVQSYKSDAGPVSSGTTLGDLLKEQMGGDDS